LMRATLIPEPADAFLVAVPTSFRGENHKPDLSYIRAAARAIAPVLEKGNIIILESTSPVGTTEKMAEWLAEARPDLSFPQDLGEASDIRIAHCPERVLPGKVMSELVSNDRVIGGMTAKCSQLAVSLYKIFVEGECIVTNSRTAEMAKLTENSFRDVNIAFANELSIICDKQGIDVWELISLANRHPRVNILYPGPGVGGHCIAVDPWFIVSAAGSDARLISTAREVNDAKPNWVIDKVNGAISTYLAENPKMSTASVTLACYGLTFKPDIDDLRESPALSIAERLTASHPGAVLVVDPGIWNGPRSLDRANLVDTETALEQADIHIVLVAHSVFHSFTERFTDKIYVIDACGLNSM